MTGRKVAAICRVLGIARATAYRPEKSRGPRYAKADDRIVTAQIRDVIGTRATYGSRRTRALVNRGFGTRYNVKRIRRVMELAGWVLPKHARRRTGRAHTGQIQRAVSNERWCSDVLEIASWSGEIVQIGFVLDCHDRDISRGALWSATSPRATFSSSCRPLSRVGSGTASGRTRGFNS